jgi:REP element-mobilizing transposase RayT
MATKTFGNFRRHYRIIRPTASTTLAEGNALGFSLKQCSPCKGKPNYVTIRRSMPQSLHVLSAHIIFSTKERRPWLTRNIRERVWAYQSRILQNLECNSITIGGAADHVHVLCNLTKKFPTAKVVEILKKDSSKFMKTLAIADFHWQDGYGLFSVSPSHFEAVRKYISDQEEHHKEETFQQEYLRILKKYRAPYDERYLWD